jgi:hypothetical protein
MAGASNDGKLIIKAIRNATCAGENGNGNGNESSSVNTVVSDADVYVLLVVAQKSHVVNMLYFQHVPGSAGGNIKSFGQAGRGVLNVMERWSDLVNISRSSKSSSDVHVHIQDIVLNATTSKMAVTVTVSQTESSSSSSSSSSAQHFVGLFSVDIDFSNLFSFKYLKQFDEPSVPQDSVKQVPLVRFYPSTSADEVNVVAIAWNRRYIQIRNC